jgi:osmotically-inducible protein OsmY
MLILKNLVNPVKLGGCNGHTLRQGTSEGQIKEEIDMSSRYDDRDEERRGRNYGRRSESDYDRSYGERSQGYGRDENERDRYSTESRWRGQYGGGREYGGSQSRGGQYGGEYDRGENRGWELGREYGGGQSRGLQSGGSEYGQSRGAQWGGSQYGGGEYGGGQYTGGQYGGSQYGTGRWGGGQNWRSGRENRPDREDYSTRGWDRDYTSGRQSRYGSSERDYGQSSFGFGERYGERGRGYSGYEGRGDYDRGDYGSQQERGWWDRASDAVASWFGDEEAERRRRMDEQRRYPGRGPKGYRRSDDRIKEDVNDRLSEGYLDASDVEVSVMNAEVTLTGTVNSRSDKRRAEDIAESVAGVTNVENRIRVKQSNMDRYTGVDTSSTSGTTDGTTGTSASATGTTGAARGRTAGTT